MNVPEGEQHDGALFCVRARAWSFCPCSHSEPAQRCEASLFPPLSRRNRGALAQGHTVVSLRQHSTAAPSEPGEALLRTPHPGSSCFSQLSVLWTVQGKWSPHSLPLSRSLLGVSTWAFRCWRRLSSQVPPHCQACQALLEF